ncbi:MAG: hypothetical protein JW885_05435 [Deltaproteobacteria bacterium]|nr:hypothetical protein [Candidatus Zymogenaceae bacterium]
MTIGILLICAFFLPWAAQTEGCADDAAIIRDNISGYSLAVEGTAPRAVLAPLSGLIIGLLALFLIGKARPFARSLVSLGEIFPALYAWIYVNFEVFFLSPLVERFGYIITSLLMVSIPVLSFIESVVHLPLMNRNKRIIVIIVIVIGVVLCAAMNVYDTVT